VAFGVSITEDLADFFPCRVTWDLVDGSVKNRPRLRDMGPIFG